MDTQSQAQGSLFEFYVAAAVLLGLVECFFGYRIFRFLLGVAGFIAAAVVAGSLGYELSDGSELVSIISGLAGGIAGAFLAYYLYIVGVFVFGAVLGFIIASYVFGLLDKGPVTLVLAVSAGVCGVLAAIFQKPMIIIATAFGGACAAVTGVSYFIMRNFHPLDPGLLGALGEDQLYWMTLIWFALGVCGLVVQLKTLPRKPGPVTAGPAAEPEAPSGSEDGPGA